MPSVRETLISLTLALAVEAAGWYPWLALMDTAAGPGLHPGPAWLGGALAAGAGLGLWLRQSRRHPAPWQGAAMLGAAVLAGAAAGSATPMARQLQAAGLALAAWRGSEAALRLHDHDTAYRRAVYGLDGLLLLLGVRAIAGLPLAGAALWLSILLAAGLPLLARARMAELSRRWDDTAGAGPSGSSRLLVSVTLGVVALAGLLAVGLGLYHEELRAGAGTVLRWLGQAAALLLLPLVWLLYTLLGPLLDWLANRLWQGVDGAPADSGLLELPPPGEALLSDPAALQRLGAGLLAALAAGVAIWVLLRARRWSPVQAESDAALAEERSSTWSWERLLRRGRPDAEAADPPAVRRVRRLYRRLQLAGHRRGLPRRAAETPEQYGRRLAAAGWPAGLLAAVTELYHQVRYGSQLPAPGQVEQAEQAVGALRPGRPTDLSGRGGPARPDRAELG